MRTKARILSVVALLMVTLTSLFAQVTTSGINGRVTDGKEELMGASVLAIHLPSGTSYGTITNLDGRYTLSGMRAGGPYKVTFSYVGYVSEEHINLTLPLGEPIVLNSKLREQSFELSEAVVVGKAGFNSQRTGSASNINQGQLEKMPTISRSINDFTRLVPQASPTGSGMSFAGANNRYNSFQIDGAVNNDVFGLSSAGTNGGQAGANPISLDAIEEIQVVIAPFDVRQSGFTGGGVNAITKSGTNDFKATAYFYGNNQNFAGSTAGKGISDRKKLTDQTDAQYGFTFGGPIIKNKLFFFVNAEQQQKAYPLAYNVAPEGKAAGGQYSAVTREDADAIMNKVMEITGGQYDGGGYNPRDVFTNNTKALARVDWNINKRNKFQVRYSYLTAENLSMSRTLTTLRFNDNGFVMNNSTHSLVAELNSQFKNNMSNEFRAGYTRVRDNRNLETDNPFPYVRIEHAGNFIQLGTESNSGANRLDQDIVTVTNNFNWTVGSHQLTFGTHNEFFFMENLYIPNLHGNYTYSSLADFMSIGTANEALPKTYIHQHAKVDVTGRKDWAPRFGAGQIGIYAQDQWDVNSRFRLTYGVRLDMPIFFDNPTKNTHFNSSPIAQKHNLDNSTMPKATPLVSPRVGFRWNMKEDRSSVLRGGAGIFTGRIPFVWIANSFANTGVEFQSYRMATPSEFPAGFKFNSDVNNQPTGNAQNSTAINLVSKDFKFPQVFRANLAWEQQLPFGVKATIEGLYTKNLNDITLNNLAYEEMPSGETVGNGGDQRPRMQKVSGLEAANGQTYTDVLLLENTAKGYTWNMSAKFEKTFNFGLDLMAAYTIGESKSVNSGTSSVAFSNWQFNETKGNPNKAELGYSDFDNRHRIIAAATYSKGYAKYFKTSVSLMYSGNTGSNYSVIYNGDINNDGVRGNDLMYVPTREEASKMNFRNFTGNSNTPALSPAQQLENLNKYIDGHKELSKLRGQYAERNAMRADFEHHFDIRVAQDFDVYFGKRKNTIQLSLDILNIGNLFNRSWGLYHAPGFNHNPLAVVGRANGSPEFQFTTDPNRQWIGISDYSSRWRMQLGAKYIF